jgi:uncharacterized protein YbjT (DUF2867 family)
LRKLGAEVVVGDLRDPPSVALACNGASAVVAAAHGFPGIGTNNPFTVDEAGNRTLIDQAKSAGVEQLIYVSILGASPDHQVDFFRIKLAVEEELKRSGLGYTIVRASAFMESWAAIVGEPLLKLGKTTIFGAGTNPVSFVSADDVAAYVLLALDDPRARNRVLEVSGPESHPLNQVADIFETVTGRRGARKHVPRWLMRTMSKLIRPLNPSLSRMMSAGVYMDTGNQQFDTSATRQEFPLPLTRLEDFVRQRYGEPTVPRPPTAPPGPPAA